MRSEDVDLIHILFPNVGVAGLNFNPFQAQVNKVGFYLPIIGVIRFYCSNELIPIFFFFVFNIIRLPNPRVVRLKVVYLFLSKNPCFENNI